MHRRPLGNGRRLAIIAAIVMLIGAALPWYVLGGDGKLPPTTFHATDLGGSGILVLLSGLATLALVSLPYAAGDRPLDVDRSFAYALLAVVAIIGLVLWIPTTLDAPEGMLPTRAYGYWLDVIGALMLARAAYDVALEPPRL